MLEALQLDCKRESDRIVQFIRQRVSEAGYERAVVGLSGGIDSALTACLCAAALGPRNVRGMVLPYKSSNPNSERDALLQADALGIDVERFDITDMVAPFVRHYPDLTPRRKGNIMARSRMIALFDQSVAFRALVAGTSNRTELLLGYFTIYGDGASSFEPIAHLYKCQVRALSRHVGVVRAIIDKAPSADLWQGQTDEAELGFTYDEADAILYLNTERGLSVPQIVDQGYDAPVVEAVLYRMRSTAFKRQPVPCLPTEEGHTV